jgi:serine/threonine protein kinase
VFAPGRRIRQFELREEVGRGGMGVVFKAWDTMLQRFVAIKVLSRDPDAGSIGPDLDGRTERLLREARAASQIQHPNVVRTYEVLFEDDAACLVLEFVEGVTLRRRLAQGPIEWQEAERIANGIARGLAAAHELHIVHADMKPDNVILARSGIPMITDFGLSRFFDPEGGSTLTDAIKGTPAYIAPEILHGARADMRSDVYATGILFYELFTGARPFAAPNQAALFQAILSQPTPSVGAVRPDLPLRLTRVIDRMIVRDPEQRVQDGIALVEEMEKASSGRLPPPVDLDAAELPSSAPGRPGRRMPLVVAAGVLGAAAALLFIGIPRGERQDTETLVVSGTVRDDQGNPVPNALVTFDGYLFGVQTSTDGAFHGNLSDVRPRDSVMLRVSHDQYYTETRWIRVGIDPLDSLPVVMRSAGSFTGRPRR